MKTVIEMAREAGFDSVIQTASGISIAIDMRKIQRFAELVRADERARMAEQPAQSTADKSELETVPANGGLLPAQQEPVACRDEMCACRGGPCASCADGEREKEQPAQPQQEPVTAITRYELLRMAQAAGLEEEFLVDPLSEQRFRLFAQLAASALAPQQPTAQRKPLTDEQWQSIADTLGCIITRGQKDAIEATIGIKENT